MLFERIKTALILLPVALLVMYVGGILLQFAALLVYAAINYEFYHIISRESRRPPLQHLAVSLLLPLGYYYSGLA
ncbi:MAG: hypothetical protein KDD44_07170, partial [Bdellovibrionales bacterium]|nr:hypothetical protein [Bdellovibrionales bacterium]